MPNISQVGREMPSSPIRKLMPFANAAKSNGKKVIHLNIGQPDIDTPKEAIEALKSDSRSLIEYSPSEGFLSYRQSVSSYYKNAGLGVEVEDVIVTTGGSEALVFAFMSCMDSGSEVIIPEPFYANYIGFAMMAGVKIVPLTTKIEDDFSLPSVDVFEEKISPKTRGILICNPGNPTGKVYSKEELTRISDLVKKHDLFLFSDEVYREFCYDGATPHSVLQLENLSENVILIDSVSKRFSMCGARIGAVITKNKEVISSVMKYAMTRLSPPTLGQIASEGAFKAPPSYFSDVRDRYVKRRDLMVNGLNDIQGVLCPNPGGAFYAVCRLPVDDSDKFCKWMLEYFEYNGETVMMAPAQGFYATPGAGKDEVRIAYVLDLPILERAVKCIKLGLEQYPGRTN